jgi:hypothetical protein
MRSLVGQPLLAVHFCFAEVAQDSQEWLPYQTRELTRHETFRANPMLEFLQTCTKPAARACTADNLVSALSITDSPSFLSKS